MMSSRLAWRVAAVAAFAATAVLAVALSRGAPMDTASFVSAGSGISATQGPAPRGMSAQATSATRCDASRLRIRVSGGGPAMRYAVEFTNVSPSTCTLTGYPSVSAYGARGAQVGNAAARDTSAVRRIVLAPGASADARVVASPTSFGARLCHAVTADGLHVVPPGQTDGQDVQHTLPACSARGHQAPVFLRVLAIQAAPKVALAG
ncbi:MAG TPA: DUF4232 domain-containing protein [Trebonia sp.]|jgi:hypothetical protein|nr:DUF4232 domain-containing protein [Trebonia sp.]